MQVSYLDIKSLETTFFKRMQLNNYKTAKYLIPAAGKNSRCKLLKFPEQRLGFYLYNEVHL